MANVIPSVHFGRHAFGLGWTYHLNPTYFNAEPSYNYDYIDDTRGTLAPVVSLKFKNSSGMILQYVYGDHFFKYGVRATMIRYESEKLETLDAVYNQTTAGSYSRTVSGSGIGLFVQIGK